MATKTKTKTYEVPWTEDGSLVNYVYAHGKTWDEKLRTHVPVIWKPPEPFHAVIQLVEVQHGRGRLTVWWKNVLTGARYPMTGSEFNRLVTEAEWQGPLLIDGLWKPVKRGANFNVEHVPAEEA